MIQHIVMWKLDAEAEEARTAAFDAIAGALRPLADVIPGIVSLEVQRNSAYADKNFDVVLLSTHESLADLDAYQVHPEHVAAAAIVRQHVSARASVDFEG